MIYKNQSNLKAVYNIYWENKNKVNIGVKFRNNYLENKVES